jgi:hypothetical protein
MNPGDRIEIQWEDAELNETPHFLTPEECVEGYALPIITQVGYFVAQTRHMLVIAFETKEGKFRDCSCIPTGMIRSVTPISPSASR